VGYYLVEYSPTYDSEVPDLYRALEGNSPYFYTSTPIGVIKYSLLLH
jgi:hypothetical protein